MRACPRSRSIHQDLRWWHWNSPPLGRVQRLRRTRHIALLHRLLIVRLPLHLCIYIILIPLQQRLLLLLLIVDRDKASIWARRQFGNHPPSYLCCFLGNGAGVACGVLGMAAGVGVAACGDEEGEVEEPGEDCALGRAIHRA